MQNEKNSSDSVKVSNIILHHLNEIYDIVSDIPVLPDWQKELEIRFRIIQDVALNNIPSSVTIPEDDLEKNNSTIIAAVNGTRD